MNVNPHSSFPTTSDIRHSSLPTTSDIRHSSFVIRHFSFVILAALAFAAANASAASGVAVPTFAFAGRLTDSSHAAFDSNLVATVYAYNLDGSLLAKTTTFYRPDTRRNYALEIPLATAPADGYAQQGDRLKLTVTDSENNAWEGVVSLDKSIVGEPGGVRDIDIVCGKDENGDGIDDDLYDMLYWDWVYSDYYRWDEDFDPKKDYDGDGVSTLDETFAGTDPYDPDDSLRITRYVRDERAGDELAFPARSRRAYVVESTTNLTDKASWAAVEVMREDASVQKVIAIPSTERASTLTVYLFPFPIPVSDTNRFYRVRME